MFGAKATWAIVVVAVMVLGGLATGVILARSPSPPSASSSASTSASTTSQAATTHPAHVEAPALSTAGQAPARSAPPQLPKTPEAGGPHPGTIQAYEPVPGGATTEDPAVAYDTTSYEVILNVYQTLVSYNGSSTATMVPTLATCVPGQGTQCTTDYGGGFTGINNATGAIFTGTNGVPKYWTFVLDPAARFYDPATAKSWSVYPSDVMFSVARTLGFSTVPYATKTAGWILAQSLLPPGNATWDSGTHYPFNNTPANLLGSMLINDSTYCPAKAMDGTHGNGCITFVADGSQQYWPEFLDFVEDNLGASVVPCGWFTYENAGVPGWAGTTAAKGDGSCPLPNGGTTTANSAWSTYLASLSPTAWDTFEGLDANWPAPQPNVQWSMVGSGPYYASVTPGLSYALAPNPSYLQPSGCSGAAGLAKYTGYCDPAPGKYIPNIDVTWETAEEGDSLGTSAVLAGTADFAGIYTTQTSTLLGFVKSGIWQYDIFPTLSTAFTPINLAVDYSAYNTTFAGTPLESNPIPATAFTDLGLRDFYIAAYPYTTIEKTINTVDGVQYAFNAGGPIPYGMGNYYPANVSWPYLQGDPVNTTTGTASWWWSQLTTSSSPYYNATIATKCTSSSPCTWPIGYFDGAPADLTLINDWAADIKSISGGALSPWALPMTFTQFLGSLVGPYESPLVGAVGFGWAPDYPDPTDYVAPMAQPGGDYTAPDTFNDQLFLPQYEKNATCGHNGLNYANLTYWAHQAQSPAGSALTSTCQGVAYSVASFFMGVAGALPSGAQRVLDYNLIEQITNALGMYVYNGQSNELIGFAPWINASSINENPVIGGGGDLVWYQVEYSSRVYNITITENGLPSSTKWSATVGPTTQSTTTTSTSATFVFPGEANGTHNWSVVFEPGYTATASNGTVKIAGDNVTETVTYATFSATTVDVYFNQTGLVSNTSWTVVVSGYGSLSSAQPSIVFPLPVSTTYPYQAQYVLGYHLPAVGSAIVGTTPASTPVVYAGSVAETFLVKLTESGLPIGSTWSVTIGPTGSGYTSTSTNTTVTFYETNGTYAIALSVPKGYVVPAATASVIVNNATLLVSVPCATVVNETVLTFTETGLTTAHPWSVSIANFTVGSTGASLTFSLPNATYHWTNTPIPGWFATNASGSVTIAGKAVGVPIKFALYTYAVTFFEGGLKTGSVWSVTLGNSTANMTTLKGGVYDLMTNLSNGTFPFTVGSVSGFTATPASGAVTVSSGATSVVIIFAPVPPTYTVTFTPSGLSSGTSWTVYFGGQTQAGKSPTALVFTVTNASWTYSASASGYTASPSGGTVVVNGKDVSLTVGFKSSSTTPAWTYLGMLAYGLIAALAVLTVLGFVLAARYSRRTKPPTAPESWTQGTPPGKDDAGEAPKEAVKDDASGPKT